MNSISKTVCYNWIANYLTLNLKMSCIFCEIAKWNASSWKIYQDKDICAFFDYYPASKWHVLIAPNDHYKNLFEIPDEILSKISIFSKRLSLFYRDKLGIHNINIVQSNWETAGQEVFHYHMHVIPRNIDDKVNLQWIPDEDIRNEYDELQKFISEEIKNHPIKEWINSKS